MTGVEAVRNALHEVVDPCSAATGSDLDVVELGLVKAIDVEDGHVGIELRLTTPACHMVPYFVTEAERHVGALPGVDSVGVETDAGLEWREVFMTEAGRRKRRAALDRRAARDSDGPATTADRPAPPTVE